MFRQIAAASLLIGLVPSAHSATPTASEVKILFGTGQAGIEAISRILERDSALISEQTHALGALRYYGAPAVPLLLTAITEHGADVRWEEPLVDTASHLADRRLVPYLSQSSRTAKSLQNREQALLGLGALAGQIIATVEVTDPHTGLSKGTIIGPDFNSNDNIGSIGIRLIEQDRAAIRLLVVEIQKTKGTSDRLVRTAGLVLERLDRMDKAIAEARANLAPKQ